MRVFPWLFAVLSIVPAILAAVAGARGRWDLFAILLLLVALCIIAGALFSQYLAEKRRNACIAEVRDFFVAHGGRRDLDVTDGVRLRAIMRSHGYDIMAPSGIEGAGVRDEIDRILCAAEAEARHFPEACV